VFVSSRSIECPRDSSGPSLPRILSERCRRRTWRSCVGIRAAFERGDPGAFFDPAIEAVDVEWVLTEQMEGRAVWTGREEIFEFLRTWTEQFDDWSFQVDRLIDAGDDRVVVLLHQSGTGKGSGVPVEWNSGVVYELRDGRVVRATNYSTLAEALEAAGLSE
jgi:ketosteroid isomerase-like protein